MSGWHGSQGLGPISSQSLSGLRQAMEPHEHPRSFRPAAINWAVLLATDGAVALTWKVAGVKQVKNETDVRP